MKLVAAFNFQFDLPWLVSACPGLKSVEHLMVVVGYSSKPAPFVEQAAHIGLGGRVSHHAVALPIAYGSHHTKAFLVEFKAGLRVIITSGNFIHCDFNYKTQSIWWQDFPPKDFGSESSSPFEDDLCDYLAALKLPDQAASQLQQLVAHHDLSSARGALVASVPGFHFGPKLNKYGHMRVRRLLSKEPLPGPDWRTASQLVMQCSSMGSLSDKWLLQEELAVSLMSSAARGFVPSVRPSEALASPLPLNRVHLVWPTVQEVRNSLEGWAAGLSVPAPSKNVDRPFLHPLYAAWGGQPSGRMRASPHIKSYTRFLGHQVAWVMTGSHNVSMAAWGQLQAKKGQGVGLSIRSYELSMLFTPRNEAAYRQHRHHSFCCHPMPGQGLPTCTTQQQEQVQFWTMEHELGRQTDQGAGFAGTNASDTVEGVVRVMLPLPYSLPPQRYTGQDQPWMVDAQHEGLDLLGNASNRP
mmetsp:Transcript_19267/g.33254  ORF Transcript_19267/g.33254 Transcript_19267/m.33254 type:complete len:467 (-) Transcript_19267:635-2035(-)